MYRESVFQTFKVLYTGGQSSPKVVLIVYRTGLLTIRIDASVSNFGDKIASSYLPISLCYSLPDIFAVGEDVKVSNQR